jgi:hypothetical protein
MTLERLNRLPVSNLVYQEIYRRLAGQARRGDTSLPSESEGDRESLFSADKVTSISAVASVTATAKATNDTLQDVEPSVVAVNLSGLTYTISTGIKFVDVPGLADKQPRNYFATTTDFVNPAARAARTAPAEALRTT